MEFGGIAKGKSFYTCFSLYVSSFAFQGISRAAFVGQLKRFMPSIQPDDAEYALSGVRALALNTKGQIIEDFVFEKLTFGSAKVLNVRNAPSPAATSSLAIGEMIAAECKNHFT